MSESPLERHLHAQHAALTGWAMEPNRTARTQVWREGFTRKLENQIDPDRLLPPDELARRVEMARLAHLAKARGAAAKKAREKREAKARAQAQ